MSNRIEEKIAILSLSKIRVSLKVLEKDKVHSIDIKKYRSLIIKEFREFQVLKQLKNKCESIIARYSIFCNAKGYMVKKNTRKPLHTDGFNCLSLNRFNKKQTKLRKKYKRLKNFKLIPEFLKSKIENKIIETEEKIFLSDNWHKVRDLQKYKYPNFTVTKAIKDVVSKIITDTIMENYSKNKIDYKVLEKELEKQFSQKLFGVEQYLEIIASQTVQELISLKFKNKSPKISKEESRLLEVFEVLKSEYTKLLQNKNSLYSNKYIDKEDENDSKL